MIKQAYELGATVVFDIENDTTEVVCVTESGSMEVVIEACGKIKDWCVTGLVDEHCDYIEGLI